MIELNKRQVEIVKLLTADACSVAQLALRYGVSEKTIRTDLSSISLLVSRHSLILKKGKHARYSISGSPSSLRQLPQQLGSRQPAASRRPYLIILALCANPVITYQKLAALCGVSRQTVINTMGKVDILLEKEGLTVRKEPHRGLRLKGEEVNIRNVFLKCLQALPEYPYTDLGFEPERMKAAVGSAKTRMRQLGGLSQPEPMTGLVAFSLYRHDTGQPVTFAGSMESPAFRDIPSADERAYLSYMTATGQRAGPGTAGRQDKAARQIAGALLNALQPLYPANPVADETLIQAFTAHIQAAIDRMQAGIDQDNPMLTQIKMSIPFLFEFTSRQLETLASCTRIRFSQNEIAYIAIYLESIFESGRQFEKLRILVVCHFGAASGLALKTRLEKMAFDCTFKGPLPVPDALELLEKEPFDLVIATCSFDCPAPLMVVGPMPSPDELAMINNRLNQDAYTKTCNHFINGYSRTGSQTHFLRDYIPAEHIQLCSWTMDWIEAIKEAARPLTDSGKITRGYVSRMIQAVLEYGTYMVLTPETAYVHAGVEDGVTENCTALLVLPAVISFGQKRIKPVKNIVVLGIRQKDGNHLLEIASILEKEENLNTLRMQPLSADIVGSLHD